jgi:hypothetical protein
VQLSQRFTETCRHLANTRSGFKGTIHNRDYESAFHPVPPRGRYYCEDRTARKQTSLRTRDEKAALTLLHAKNEAERQPILNLQLARTYLTACDSALTARTWQAPRPLARRQTRRTAVGGSGRMAQGTAPRLRMRPAADGNAGTSTSSSVAAPLGTVSAKDSPRKTPQGFSCQSLPAVPSRCFRTAACNQDATANSLRGDWLSAPRQQNGR